MAKKPDLNALGLIKSQQRWAIRFGPVDVSPAFAGGTVNAAINTGNDAQVKLDFQRCAATPDYFAGLGVAIEHEGTSYPRFTGTVASVEPTATGASVQALGMLSLSEQILGTFVHRGFTGPELIYTLARSGGMREDQLNIQGLDALPRETFEVVVPVSGIIVEQATDFAGVRFLPPDTASRVLAGLDTSEGAYAEFDAPTYALALVTATRALAAEEQGIADIDFALAWLITFLRYGHAVLPSGETLRFGRNDSLARPTRHELVAVRGLLTGRFWLRRPAFLPQPHSLPLLPDGSRFQADIPQLTLQERLAFSALARAATESDLLARVLALFEAIEFYASGTTVEHTFSSDELEAVKSSVPLTLKPEQKSRVNDFIAGLNNPPLRRLLMKALDMDGVSYMPEEIKLLWRLRTLRNDVVHGKSKEMPKAEDVEYATSIVARMLVYRAARRRQDT
ncbi:hypothetical protein [Catenulispora pinisilvae]|uniref:hypothetical protein n=1 Tax=Catenulispora pinisilvae TaxID=2705253 RepID=UPI001890C3C9|nr:hypothetical protein [Catenulispora pinisilvae]